MNQKVAIGILTFVNLVVAAFFGFAYFAFTENIVVENVQGEIYRYILYFVAGLFLESVMYISNISVMLFILDDEDKVTKYCLGIGVAALCMLIGISAVEVAFNI